MSDGDGTNKFDEGVLGSCEALALEQVADSNDEDHENPWGLAGIR